MRKRTPELQYLHSIWSPRPGGGYGGGDGGGAKDVFKRLKYSFLSLPRAVQVLILLISGLYLLVLFLPAHVELTLITTLSLTPVDVIGGKVWQIVTYLPVHARNDPIGMLFDVIILWSLGGIFAQRWRQMHFLFFYLAGSIGGALFDLLLYLIFGSAFAAPVWGASAASFSLFVAFFLIFGEQQVSVFGSKPFKGKWVFWAVFGLQLLFFVTGGNPAFGVQLGGVITGWLMVTGRWRPRKFKTWMDKLKGKTAQARRQRQKSRFRVIH